MARKKSRSKKSGSKKSRRKAMGRRKGARRSKGHIPLEILEKRAKRLTKLVRSRGGKV